MMAILVGGPAPGINSVIGAVRAAGTSSLIGVWMLFAAATVTEAQSPRTRHVLFLGSYEPGYNWGDDLVLGMRSVLEAQPYPTELWIEHMDSRRFSSAAHVARFEDLLRFKHGERSFDAIVSADDAALQFLLDRHDLLFPGLPVVFLGINNWELADRVDRKVYTGLREVLRTEAMLALAMTLGPGTRRVVVVGDAAPTAAAQIQAYRAIAPKRPELRFEFFDGARLSLEEILEGLETTSREDAVVTTAFTRDVTGRYFPSDEALARIARAARAPVYSASVSRLGQGLLAGSENVGLRHGTRAAQKVVAVLAGTTPGSVPVETDEGARFLIDSVQAARWGIDYRLLPQNVLLVNEPSSFYQANKYLIWAGGGLILLQTLVIGAIVVNVSQRKQAESARRESEELYRLITDNTGDLISLFDRDGRRVYASPSVRRVLGHEPTQLVLSALNGDSHPEEVPLVTGAWEHVLAGEEVLVTFRARHADGSWRWLEAWAKQVTHRGKPHVLGVARDVTERKLAEEARRRSEADLKLALDAGRLGDWKWDILTGEVTWSPLCKALYGLPPETEVSYERFLAAVHPDDRAATQAALERAVEARTDYDIEKRIVWPDGSVRWTASRGRVFCDPSGRPVRMAGVTMDTTERMRAEEALRESERRLADAQRVAHLGYWERDLDTDTLSWSAETFRIYEMTHREGPLARSEVWPRVHPDDRSRLIEAADEALRGGPRYEVEFRVVRPDGTLRTLHSQGDIVRDESGRPRRMFGTVQDVTDRKNAEEALRESERRLAEAQRIAHVGYWDRDLETDRITWSVETFRIFGLKVQEGSLDLAEVLQCVHTEDRSRMVEGADQALRGGPRYDVEYRVIRPDGTIRIVHSQGDVIKDESGRPRRMFGTVQDITSRRQAELELRASEARFRVLVDHATDAFFLHDDQGTILDVNRQACESLGYSREELVGKTPYDLDGDADRSFMDGMGARLERGEVIAFDSRHRRKDGTLLPVEVRVRPFSQGGRRFAVSLARDVTERRRYQEQLESSLHEKEALLRELHHRVKNNLQVVSSLLSLQARRVTDGPTLDALRESQNRIRSMAMVHEMLYHAKGLPRIDARKYTDDLVANVFRSYGAGSDRIRLRSAVEGMELGIDLALPVGLLLNELVSNSLKHAFPDQREGEIRVELGPAPDGSLVLRVSDTGIGLPPGMGSGDPAALGLELVRAVSGQLGATLRVTSRDGTAVEVTVPRGEGA